MSTYKTRTLSVLAAGSLLLATSFAATKPVTVQLKDAKGGSVGTAVISPVKGGDGVTVKLNLVNLPPGEHALHFHQNPKCEAPGFTTAGGHFNPEKKQHGMDNPQGHHAGDMANFTVDAKGKAKTTITDNAVNLGDGDHSLFSNGGTALMIHAKADDMKTDPSGNAGDRIACGTITK
ncbi:MAG: superoxide dismutase family protein [Bryobacteraceae bacterium]